MNGDCSHVIFRNIISGNSRLLMEISEPELLYKDETHQIIGVCMEVHRHLGHGFLEIVYKDAIELELRRRSAIVEREREFQIVYKDVILPHSSLPTLLLMKKLYWK